jgi:hypothetical protein
LANVFHKEICVESLYVYVSSFHTKQFQEDIPWFLATTEQIQKQTKKGKSRKKTAMKMKSTKSSKSKEK